MIWNEWVVCCCVGDIGHFCWSPCRRLCDQALCLEPLTLWLSSCRPLSCLLAAGRDVILFREDDPFFFPLSRVVDLLPRNVTLRARLAGDLAALDEGEDIAGENVIRADGLVEIC